MALPRPRLAPKVASVALLTPFVALVVVLRRLSAPTAIESRAILMKKKKLDI